MKRRPAPTRFAAVAIAWLAFCGEPAGCAAASEAPVAVLSSSGVAAYREAGEGFRTAMGPLAATVEWFELEGANTARVLDAVRLARPRVVVAMGSRATEAAAGLGIPVVSTMVLKDGGEQGAAGNDPRRVLTRISLDVPASVVLARTKELLPGRRRLAVILSRARSKLDLPEIQNQAAALGYSTRFISCEGPREMLDALRGLRGQVDLVWCLPDRALYSPVSMTALILASIRNRLPLIGFSESFVKAGAAVGFYASHREIGVQTAEVVRRFQEGRQTFAREAPRTVKTAVNERVLRLLGIELRTPHGAGEVEFVK